MDSLPHLMMAASAASDAFFADLADTTKGVLLVLALIAMVGFIIWAHVDEARKRRRVVSAVARSLGVEVVGGSVLCTIEGTRMGFGWHTAFGHRGAPTRATLNALFQLPLDVGLEAQPWDRWSTRPSSVFPQALAGRVAMSARDPIRAAAYFNAEVVHALLALGDDGVGDYKLNDNGVFFESFGAATASSALANMHKVARLCSALERARAWVPVAPALAAHERQWALTAETAGLWWTRAPLAMSGTLGPYGFCAVARYRGGAYDLVLEFRFVRPLACNLSVRSRPRTTRVGRGDRLEIRSSHPELASHILDAGVTNQLLHADSECDVCLDDEKLTFATRMGPEPAILNRFISLGRVLVESIERRRVELVEPER